MKKILDYEIPKKYIKDEKKFEKTITSYNRIIAKRESSIEITDSKFAGEPYFPKELEYPKDSRGIPMKLLAQLNFEKMPKIPKMPAKGILQFYISTEDDQYGADFNDLENQKNFKIIYFDEIIKDKNMLMDDFSFIKSTEESNFPIHYDSKLYFEKMEELVSTGDFHFEKIFGLSSYDYFEKEKDFDDYCEYYSGAGHKVGGYPFFTQEDPRDIGNIYKDHNILLLQIDDDDEAGIMWGDCGVANFFIRESDLVKLDFSKVVFNWDCY